MAVIGALILLWLTDRIRIANANQTDNSNFPMLFKHRVAPLTASRTGRVPVYYNA
jgi:hypothetical protein